MLADPANAATTAATDDAMGLGSDQPVESAKPDLPDELTEGAPTSLHDLPPPDDGDLANREQAHNNGASNPPALQVEAADTRISLDAKAEDDGRDQGRKHHKKDKDSKRERKDRKRSRSRSRRSKDDSYRSRSGEPSRRHRSRSRLRERSQERSRDRKRHYRSRSRSRSRDRDLRRDYRSRSGSRHHKRRTSRSRSGSPGHRSSSAEYGGYVPRRRHSDMPVRQAPPTNADPFYYLRQSAPVPNNPQEALRLWQEQQLRSRQLVLQQQAASAAAAASKTQREVYVGNLAAGLVKEAELRQLFDTALQASFPGSEAPGTEPVVNVSMHSDGRYAFVELRTPEMATAALQLSGQVQLMGQAISVGRPSGYVDPSKAAVAAQQAAAALAAFTAGDTSVVTLPAPPALAAAAGSLGANSPAMMKPGTPGTPGTTLPLAAPPTTCLQVVGMVTTATLEDDEEYADTVGDLKEECGKYGAVVSVKIPRPSPPTGTAALLGTGLFGKALVQFADVESCQKAKESIHGRMYAGSTLVATFVSPDLFNAA